VAWKPDYCTSAELKAFTRINDAVDDNQVALAVTAASRGVDFATNRQFGKVDAPEARYFTASWRSSECRWVVPIDDLMTTSGLSVAYDSAGDRTFTSALDVPTPAPLNAAAEGDPWTELLLAKTGSQAFSWAGAVRVTATWGWTAVPDTIKQATLLQGSRILARRNSPYGVAGSPANGGSELRLLAKLDPDVEAMVKNYKRWWAVA
jgi:hypothetical protein